MQVRAAYARRQSAPIEVGDFALDGPREREVLIEIKAAGLCHSDMSFFNGARDWADYPIVLGHESRHPRRHTRMWDLPGLST